MKEQVVRFGLVGLTNTAIGYAIILAAMLLGAGDYLANALGYGLGLSAAYLLHRRFTFRLSGQGNWREAARFVVTAALSFCVNLAVLRAAREAGYVGNPLAQLAAMAAYSVSFFVLARSWVFLQRRERTAAR
ncbi:GtrA family protein [Qipengyuania sp. 6B39]|uniref:GtrA family protein n=1 Tax=Qipengyuania proteolytica TaxID=2867239 RepID=UPI001C8A1868|nr:GtrA family protein [Qipengyuania proteolytica]MBX7495376.1 GtrA family protein [Qipengyuania proteolytica]